ncbi:MAG: CRISPR-associated helicase Cas3' [Bryobacteraceae bacterium]|nr:CRISPR-associated helicase Cas3' [Bryobacterales bacterium]NUN03352.1 CRISPR-associated helicase Cas3' [Bryobacteraceae bacterium]
MPKLGDVLRHEDCWAKTKEDSAPGINVRDHCLNVGCVAEALLSLFHTPLQELTPQGIASLAALHDVGKVSPGFQVKSEAWLALHALRDRALQERWVWYEADHAKISQSTTQKLLGMPNLDGWAAAVGAHHGRVSGRLVEDVPWEPERLRLAAELIAEFGALPNTPPSDAVIWLTAGLIAVADWIGSDEKQFPQEARWDLTDRRQRAQAALAKIGLRPARARELSGFRDLFPNIPSPNSLQTTTLQVVREPGIYVVEGPMGCGKTEAALAAAYRLIAAGKATGLYFALPTQVTSNRIHLRVQEFVQRISEDGAEVRLAHGASWMAETETAPLLRATSPVDSEARRDAHGARSWFASGKRALLTRYGVGTIDQALLGIVAAKHFFVRQFGLAGKVVILDEVHSYDLYTGTLITELAKRLKELRCTVIVLSATLTEKRRRELLEAADDQPLGRAYPIISGVAGSFMEQKCEPPPSKTVRIRHFRGVLPVTEAMEHARNGECVLWIRNTVDDAQATYRELRSANFAGGPALALLHSRFPFFRREELEEKWMERLGKDLTKRPPGCILVSTQVAEQSVDIDADLLLTDLAPADMLLQRLGRLWRHDRRSRPSAGPEVWIQMPQADDAFLRVAGREELRAVLGKSARTYAPYVLLRSLEQWRNRARITLPGDIREILEAAYAEPSGNEPAAWRELREELERHKEKMAQSARSATAVWHIPVLPDEEGIQTRYSTYPEARLLLTHEIVRLNKDSVRLHLLSGETITISGSDWNFDAAKAIHRNLGPVPRWAVADGLRKLPRGLADYVAQAAAVGLLQPDGSVRWPGQKGATGLAYDADQGIVISRQASSCAVNEESDESYD